MSRVSLLAGLAPALLVAAPLPPAGAQTAVSAPIRDKVEARLVIGKAETGRLTKGNDRDVWELRLRPDEAVQIDLSSGDMDTVLEVYLPDAATPLASNDDTGRGTNSRLLLQRPAADAVGRYLVVVRDNAQGGGDYVLSTRKRVVPPIPAPTLIELGQPASGTLSEASPLTLGDGTLYAAFTFTGTKGARVRIDLSSADFDPIVELRRGGTSLSSNDDGGDGTASRLVYRLPEDGEYEVRATTRSDTLGAFKLQVAPLPPPKPLVIETVAAGQAVTGKFAEDSPLLPGDRPFAMYQLGGQAGEGYRVTLRADQNGRSATRPNITLGVGVDTFVGFASVLELYPSRPVTTGIFRFAEGGTVKVRVSGARNSTLAYSFTVEKINAAPAATP